METLLSFAVSFFLFHLATHPKSKFNKKLPSKKISSRFQIFPRISFEAKNRVFHVHHWMLFTPAYFLLPSVNHGLSLAPIIQGFLLGGIVQGLMYADRFRIIFHYDDYQKKVKHSSYNLSFLKKLV